MSATIKLQSNDNKVFEVDNKVAKMSGTIRDMLEDLHIDNSSDEAVPLPSIEGPILNKIVEWAEHHKDDPPPMEEEIREKRTDDIPEWDVDFLKVDQQTLFAIICAANFLNIKGLLNVAYKTLANMIKGKKVEEIRKTFNITPLPVSVDEKAAKEEAEWTEEKNDNAEKKEKKDDDVEEKEEKIDDDAEKKEEEKDEEKNVDNCMRKLNIRS